MKRNNKRKDTPDSKIESVQDLGVSSSETESPTLAHTLSFRELLSQLRRFKESSIDEMFEMREGADEGRLS